MSARLVYAEWIKLFRKRGLLWGSLVSIIGGLIIVFIILESLHLANPDRYGPVGGTNVFDAWSMGLALMGAVVAIIMGATAGTADVSSGVFRDLVATGCPRWRLFAARVPGALALLIPIVTLGFIFIAVISVFFAGSKPVPDASLMVKCYGWILLFTGFDLVLALGFASLLGSRAAAIGVLLGWQFIASPFLQQASFLGSFRRVLYSGALNRLNPIPPLNANDIWGVSYNINVAGAIVVLLMWVAVMLAAGWWRTATRDA